MFAADQWRFHRKNLNPSFKYNVIQSFYPLFNKNMKVLIEKLNARAEHGRFDLQNNLQSCAMDMICGKYPLFDFILIFSKKKKNHLFQPKKQHLAWTFGLNSKMIQYF